MNDTDAVVYKSKVSYGILVFCFIASFLGLFIILLGSNSIKITELLVTTCISLLIFGFCAYVIYSIKYSIKDHYLNVKALGMNTHIDIHTISEIKNTKNFIASPAASFDRIQITYGKAKRTIIISPLDKKGFMEHLLSINPNIKN